MDDGTARFEAAFEAAASLKKVNNYTNYIYGFLRIRDARSELARFRQSTSTVLILTTTVEVTILGINKAGKATPAFCSN